MRSELDNLMSDDIRWMRLQEAAEYYGVDWRTVRDWIRTGKLTGYRVGRFLMVRSDDLESFAKPVQVTR